MSPLQGAQAGHAPRLQRLASFLALALVQVGLLKRALGAQAAPYSKNDEKHAHASASSWRMCERK